MATDRLTAHVTLKVDSPLYRQIVADTRRQVGEQIAHRIRAELVCCEVYDGSGNYPPGHALCYWGEAAARIADDAARDCGHALHGADGGTCPGCGVTAAQAEGIVPPRDTEQTIPRIVPMTSGPVELTGDAE